MFEVKCLSNTIFQKLVLPHLIPKSILTTYTVLTIKGALAIRISPQIRGPIHTIGVKAHDIKHLICLLDPSLKATTPNPSTCVYRSAKFIATYLTHYSGVLSLRHNACISPSESRHMRRFLGSELLENRNVGVAC
jgi:hypothetical protein